MKLLLELRPALEGHAGIPQENRLLFRGLCQLEGLEVQGLLQSSSSVLADGLPMIDGNVRHSLPSHKEVDHMSRVVVSLQQPTRRERLENWRRTLQSLSSPFRLAVSTLFGFRQRLTGFDPTGQFGL